MRVLLLLTLAFSTPAWGDSLADADDERVAAVVNLSAGAGWANMDQFASGVSAYFEQLSDQVSGFSADSPGASHRIQTLDLRAQLRLPRNIFVETGVTLLDNRETTAIAIESANGEIGYLNRGLAVPLLLGVHVPLTKLITATGAVGPLLLFANTSTWDYSFGEISSFRSSAGGGLEVAAAVEHRLAWRLQATFTVRYRFLQSAELATDGAALPPVQPVTELGWTGMTGSLGLQIRLD